MKLSMFKIKPGERYQTIFYPNKKNIHWLGLEILRLESGESWRGSTEGQEAALVVLGGRCTVAVIGRKEERWEGVGGRADIFSGLPHAIYAPRQSNVEIKAESMIEIAIAKAPCEVDLTPRLIQPVDVKVVSAGVANWRRDVRLVIPPGSAISQRLIVGETVNPSGNWSGIPPHKHDEFRDGGKIENILEEFYLFKAKPSDGYGVQLIYKGDEGEAYIVGTDDVVFLPNSYHPTVAAPGVTLCYLWVLSGDDKAYNIATEPRFNWVINAEAAIRELKQ